jgi:hypothetical protein
MTQTSKPSKEKVREFMAQRRGVQEPHPRPEEVRRQLGWQLVEAARETTNRSK